MRDGGCQIHGFLNITQINLRVSHYRQECKRQRDGDGLESGNV